MHEQLDFLGQGSKLYSQHMTITHNHLFLHYILCLVILVEKKQLNHTSRGVMIILRDVCPTWDHAQQVTYSQDGPHAHVLFLMDNLT